MRSKRHVCTTAERLHDTVAHDNILYSGLHRRYVALSLPQRLGFMAPADAIIGMAYGDVKAYQLLVGAAEMQAMYGADKRQLELLGK